ncbi:hypothetical protein EXIGLDRAFT_721792 [Exidia glandulosa HHB12029]|uniref:F-box domain-containing protein n=1 Tax=Exidia glandulosa HHB12029 TaxID=1314781 RepID=A0A165QGW0_EXIGL|nr:hypothetical protein EXIGLDRAFT_721792 [Exidia glandulosa HHB12029]
MMLERSMHVPFRLDLAVVEWGGEAEEVEVTTLLARHMYRAETIHITWLDDMGPLFSAPAPVLRELAVYSIPGRIVVPQSDWAPQLHRLKLNGSFEVPAVNNPFRFLTYFSSWMEVQVLSDARRLFQLCPQLKSLSLSMITKASLPFLPVGPVPASLLSLELRSLGNTDDCDISSFVSMWHGRHMEAFVLDCQNSLIILAQHLLSRNLSPRLLELTGRTARLVADNNIEYSVQISEYGALNSHYWALLGPYLRTLTDIVTTNFLGLLWASPTLASLQTIECTAYWLAGETLSGPRMRAPQLRTLRITTTVYGTSILPNCVSGIPNILLAHLEIDGPDNKIPEFVILGETVEYVRSIDWTNLKNCARAIYVGEELIWEERGVS